MNSAIDPALLWLGACVGAQMLVVFLCVINANVYHERPLLLHAAATLVGLLTLQALIGRYPLEPRSVFLLLPAIAGLQLLDMVSSAGALRVVRRWLFAITLLVVPVLAVGAHWEPWLFPMAMVTWSGVVALLLLRAWRQSRPWSWWLLPALAALVAAAAHVFTRGNRADLDDALLLASLLTLWSGCVYVATGWRGRLHGETQARINARNTIDPLTGLATPLVLNERVNAARHMTKRYGHPSVLMLVHIENLPALAQEFGPEASEAAVLTAAVRLREALMRGGDVAARVAHARFAVLAEGAGTGQAAATVASRILVAGLKEPLPAAPAEFLHFRIVLAALPREDVASRDLLVRLSARLDQEVKGGSDRRIATMSEDELLVPVSQDTTF